MGENTIKSRIQLKNDTEANWKKAINFVPKQGEVIIYNVDESNDAPRMKIGDGVQNVNDLPFVEKKLAAVATSGDYNDLLNAPAGVGSLVTFDLTIPTVGWTDEAPYTVFLEDEKLKEFNEPIVDIILTDDEAQNELIKKAWFDVTKMETVNGGIKVYTNKVPEVEIPVHLKEILSDGYRGDSVKKVVIDHIPDASEMEDNKIYFVKVSEVEGKNYYDQYVLLDGQCCSMAARVG